MYDIAIIGAGPAGAMLARLMGRRYRVLLVETLQTGPENLARRYHAATMPLRRNILLKSLKSRVVFHPTLRRIIMRLGLRSMSIHGLQEVDHTG